MSPCSIASFCRYISQAGHRSNATPVPEQAVHASRGSLVIYQFQSHEIVLFDVRIAATANAGSNFECVGVIQVA